jgi:hypothetical protein
MTSSDDWLCPSISKAVYDTENAELKRDNVKRLTIYNKITIFFLLSPCNCKAAYDAENADTKRDNMKRFNYLQ